MHPTASHVSGIVFTRNRRNPEIAHSGSGGLAYAFQSCAHAEVQS